MIRRRDASAGAPTLVAWHVDALYVADAIPAEWGLQTDTGGAYTQVDAGALRALAATGPLVLAGWSAGCQAVRAALVAGIAPAAVLVLDGAHASMPAAAWQIDVWRDALARGRASEACTVLTCTQQTYVEGLPAGRRYTSTLRVASDAWGASGLLDPGAYRDGGALVEAHASARVDAAAHVREVREHGPRLLREIVVPWVEGHRATDPGPPPSGRRAQALAAARVELAAGVRELPAGSNTSPRIREYLAPCVRDGRLIGLSAAPWCAAFASWCVWGADRKRSALWGQAAGLPAIGYRASVAELVRDARAAGAWHDTGRPQPGDLLVMLRGGQDPRTGGMGHVEVVEDVAGPQTWTIGGNVGDRVARQQRGPSDGIVGWIAVDG